jgi:hypothetical protein
VPETVHHGHDDDQRRHAQADAEQRKGGDDRDEAFLSACAQIAHRQHAFEWAKHGDLQKSARSALLRQEQGLPR